MWNRLIPWRWMVSHLARSRGFTDPLALLARLHRFAQPSEVAEPIELLRAGVAFHARGLLNARAFQHNLDWVWPYWVERQFDPADHAFVPRAFSITHINLTHRNWTAVGLPDLDWLPIVDPRGLVTPLFDGWSLDAWVICNDGASLLPSRAVDAEQHFLPEEIAIHTRITQEAGSLETVVDVLRDANRPCCRMRLRGQTAGGGMLVLSVRPVNPEGISLVHEIRHEPAQALLRIDGAEVRLSRPPQRVWMSEYHHGDVFRFLGSGAPRDRVSCQVGLATAAAAFAIPAGEACEVVALVPMPPAHRHSSGNSSTTWENALSGVCALDVPDDRYRFLFDAAVRTLVLHSPGDVYPGPFTYRRFWFRDAAFILDALLAVGLAGRARRVLEQFPARQDGKGYFRSQEGEWDSNGAALWVMDRYRRLTGEKLPPEWEKAAARGAEWIVHKRLPDGPLPHAGLLPAGFSAEHLGLNDFYYWDDFFSAAGLRAAADLVGPHDGRGSRWLAEADRLLAAVERSLTHSEAARQEGCIPASPYRRLDAGAIGSLAASYPLRLWGPRDSRLLGTVEFLMRRCFYRGGFFQDMIHSGINAYLTLHIAQVLLRAGDPRHADLTRVVAELASPTGQWPEAIHPHTLGGCMGDGQHVWAAAEWVLMLRNCFVREEGTGLVLGSGLRPDWLTAGRPLRLGPAPTSFGTLRVEVVPQEGAVRIGCEADWRGPPPAIEAAVPGYEPRRIEGGKGSVVLPARGRPAEVSP